MVFEFGEALSTFLVYNNHVLPKVSGGLGWLGWVEQEARVEFAARLWFSAQSFKTVLSHFLSLPLSLMAAVRRGIAVVPQLEPLEAPNVTHSRGAARPISPRRQTMEDIRRAGGLRVDADVMPRVIDHQPSNSSVRPPSVDPDSGLVGLSDAGIGLPPQSQPQSQSAVGSSVNSLAGGSASGGGQSQGSPPQNSEAGQPESSTSTRSSSEPLKSNGSGNDGGKSKSKTNGALTNPWGAPRRGESWGQLIARVGDEFYGTAMTRDDDGQLREKPVTLKEAFIREAFKQAMGGNSKVTTEILRRMPNPHTGQPEGDPPSQVQVSDWRTAAIKLIAERRIAPARAIQAFGLEKARQLFQAARVDFDTDGDNAVVENQATSVVPYGQTREADDEPFEPDMNEDEDDE